MSKVVAVDVLSPGLDTAADVLHPQGTKFVLAFLNIAMCPSIVDVGSSYSSALSTALSFLSCNLDEKGTIAIALPGMFCDKTHLKGEA